MSVYSVVRWVYHVLNRVLLRHFPARGRLHTYAFRLAQRVFPTRIQARSVSEFVRTNSDHAAAPRRLPAWAEAEVAALVTFEPALAFLVGDEASVEPYFIPWDMNYVGLRYAAARRQLTGKYACLVLSGAGASAVDAVMLAAAPRPLAVVDVVGDAKLAALVHAAGADYVALPAEHLDSNDHCAVLARLVLQLAPDEVRATPHPLVVRCIERHGLAMEAVSKLGEWPRHATPGSDVPMPAART